MPPSLTRWRVEIILARFLPNLATVLRLGPAFLVYALLAAASAAYLRTARGVAAPYTRKLFHFQIFTAATVVQLVWGLKATVVFGIVVSGLVVYAAWRGDGDPLYEALARPSDRPHRTVFVLVPLVMTAAGGVVSNLWFSGFALVGYLLCGWGDAVGEPVGVRWGKRRYAVPSLFGVAAERSVEGSVAVFLAGSLAAGLALWALGLGPAAAAGAGLVCGATGTAVEAVSHHGTDNFTIQVTTSGVAYLLVA